MMGDKKMESAWLFLFLISAFIIFWAMIGYPVTIYLIGKFLGDLSIDKDYEYEPTVTVMIVAHNEESVIYDKLLNAVDLDYPRHKLEILVSSDNSTDRTNDIVKKFIESHPDYKIRLYEAQERKGKTNAQNEAAKTVTSEILVMTDANAMLDSKAIKEIVASFYSDDVAYVTGRLCYINANKSTTSASESLYWQWDLKMREVESKLYSVTAGNGAIYACRTKDYYDFDPIRCHDSAMPIHYVLQGKRAIYNKEAVAYEKAGENVKDEFSRKIRMSRNILNYWTSYFKVFNIFKYRWFSFCYFGHRFCRNNLWLAHIILLGTNFALVNKGIIFSATLMLQLAFYMIAILKQFGIKSKLGSMVYYYVITVLAQLIGAYRQATGKAKPFWEKAESTRV